MTFALADASMLLGEGTVCILMAWPFIYGILGITWWAAKRDRDRDRGLRCVLLVLLLLSSFEGTSERLSFSRDESVTVEETLDAPPEAVERALAAAPRFDRPLPLFLQLGFPRPIAARGSGLESSAASGRSSSRGRTAAPTRSPR